MFVGALALMASPMNFDLISLSTNPTKWSDTLKQFIGQLTTNCLNVFDHFVGLVLKGLIKQL